MEELDDNEDNDRITPEFFQHLCREGKEAVQPVRRDERSLVSARLADSWIFWGGFYHSSGLYNLHNERKKNPDF